MDQEYIAEKHERALAVSRELLSELSVVYAELALYRNPSGDLPTTAMTLCKLAHTLGIDRAELLRLRLITDNLAWTWSRPDHCEIEHRDACGMRLLTIVIDSMRRQWDDAIPKNK